MAPFEAFKGLEITITAGEVVEEAGGVVKKADAIIFFGAGDGAKGAKSLEELVDVTKVALGGIGTKVALGGIVDVTKVALGGIRVFGACGCHERSTGRNSGEALVDVTKVALGGIRVFWGFGTSTESRLWSEYRGFSVIRLTGQSCESGGIVCITGLS